MPHAKPIGLVVLLLAPWMLSPAIAVSCAWLLQLKFMLPGFGCSHQGPASRSVGPVPRVRQCGAEPCLQNSLCQAFLAKWLVPGPACSKALLTTPLVPGIAQDIVGARSCSPNCWCQALLAARPCLHHRLSEVLIATLLVPCLARTNVGARLRLQQSLTYSFVGARPCLQKWFEDQSLSASPHI